MKALRKDSGGYALLYVLIIVVVLCAIAAAICTVALRNYQEQARAVAQTRQLYQAEGEIEKFVALAEDVENMLLTYESTSKSGAAQEYRDQVLNFLKPDGPCAGCEASVFLNTEECRFNLVSSDTTIQATITMALKYDTYLRNEGTAENPNYVAYYKVKSATHTYNSYTITHLTAEGGEEHETE
ncbi:MAG: hypothetical protein Q4C45_00465 [Oscillospiraceae bacterium]|nr:hypothetical protein [Oscillospiraceae bacterium]